MTRKSFVFILLLFLVWSAESSFTYPMVDGVKTADVEDVTLSETEIIFDLLKQNNTGALPSIEAFSLAYKGYNNLRTTTDGLKKQLLTIVDFSLASNEKRLWVIDLTSKKILFNDLVAHGRNSGNKFAEKFSDVPNSNMSSLGFYITGKTYHGKHGLSLFLNGMDKNYNTNARKRSIVMHGAEYVSHDFINKYGRLGRSLGCPSLSMDIYKEVIETIQGGSCLFIYFPDEQFMTKSSTLNLQG